jgi:hypothetical protein
VCVQCVYGRSADLWGADVLEFKPERWLAPSAGLESPTLGPLSGTGEHKLEFDENTLLKKHSQYKFTAFNGGPRLCMGRGMLVT